MAVVRQSLKALTSLFLVSQASSAAAVDGPLLDGSQLLLGNTEFQVAPLTGVDPQQDSWATLPTQAYTAVAQSFREVYDNAKFAPSAKESYFPDSKLYKMVALPVVAVPYLEDGYQVEVFGQFYNKERHDLLNMGSDDPLYHYYAGEEAGNLNNDFAVGFGTSYLINEDMTLQTMFSTGAIPNHGDSNIAVGLDVSF
ncbi:hypothetical protein ACFSJ3_07215 [Corallincola platygyrae]|uniref:Uncharacterized protein n=1 Tax=Corallincola platygyrae TaxID=1193278 RepID=A0ABW4XL06_9GAMM